MELIKGKVNRDNYRYIKILCIDDLIKAEKNMNSLKVLKDLVMDNRQW